MDIITLAQSALMTLNISHALELIALNDDKNKSTRTPKALYDPRNYIMSIGGKRMRSVFCLMGYELYKEDVTPALDLAFALELFHNFTLVHDDIMDDAPLRRKEPTVHTKYDTNTAILSGDVMLIEVYERLANLDTEHRLKIIQLFNQTAREVCEGQSMDMTFETTDKVSIAEYLKMIELKTAVLLGAALRLGALLGGASEKDQEHLYKFAVYAGVSFQLQDDLLDVYGDPETFGKKVGGDIIQGKKTYLYLRALDLLGADEAADFKKLYQRQDLAESEKIKRVRSVFDELYISNYCTEAKGAFFDLAKSHLSQVSIKDNQKDDLLAFAKKLMDRNS